MMRSLGSRWLCVVCLGGALSACAQRFTEREAGDAAPVTAATEDGANGAGHASSDTTVGSDSGTVTDASGTTTNGEPSSQPSSGDEPSASNSAEPSPTEQQGTDPQDTNSESPSTADSSEAGPGASTATIELPNSETGATQGQGDASSQLDASALDSDAFDSDALDGSGSEPGLRDAGLDAASVDSGPPPTLAELLESYEDDDLTLAELVAGLAATDGVSVASLSQAWSGPVLLPEGEHFSGSLLVPADAILVLAPGAHLVLDEGALLDVEGQLYLLGDEQNPAEISGDGGAAFDAVRLHGGRSELHYCVLSGAQVLVRVEGTADNLVEIDNCRLDSWYNGDAAGVVVDGANEFWLHDSSIGLNTPDGEAVGMAISAANANLTVERNEFGPRSTQSDQVSISGCNEGQRSHVARNLFAGGGDDAVDVDGCDVVVDANVMRDFTRNSSAGLSFGLTTHGLITNNLFENCRVGLNTTESAQCLVLNNTIVGAVAGVVTTNEAELRMVGNIFWDNEADLDLSSSGFADIHENLIDSPDADPDDNIASDPGFVTAGDFPYGPGAGSPVLDHDYANADTLVQGMAFPVHEVKNTLALDLVGHERTFPVIDFGAIERP